MEANDAEREDLAPADEAPPGSESTGEDLCPECAGSGEVDGERCEACGGTGKVTRGIGGG